MPKVLARRWSRSAVRCWWRPSTTSATSSRNRGTLGGSLAHVDPASDPRWRRHFALDASVVARSTGGERVVPVSGPFAGPFQSSLAPGELITEHPCPGPAAGSGIGVPSMTQPASGYSIVGVAAMVVVSGGRVASARVGVTGVGEVPYRATAGGPAAGGAGAVASAACACVRRSGRQR
ncbi:MAG: FAD binding domain-containing protein [Chloroflexota bacterium]